MLDWQQTSIDMSLSVDTYIEEVGPRSSKDLDNKVPKKIYLGESARVAFKQQTAFLFLRKLGLKV